MPVGKGVDLKNLFKLTVLFFIVVMASCSANHQLNLNSDGSGSMNANYSLNPFVTALMSDLDILDSIVVTANQDIAKNSAISSGYVTSSETGQYSGSINFNDLDTLFKSNEASQIDDPIMKIEKQGSVSVVTIKMNIDNYSQLSAIIPILSDPNVSFLGPEGSIGLSENEYREMITYPFIEYATETEILSALDSSVLSMDVVVEGQVINQTGGTLLDFRTVRFEIPLYDILYLEEELNYTLSFQ